MQSQTSGIALGFLGFSLFKPDLCPSVAVKAWHNKKLAPIQVKCSDLKSEGGEVSLPDLSPEIRQFVELPGCFACCGSGQI
ncbi:unnamed protein product [Cochlearia groenlandica]